MLYCGILDPHIGQLTYLDPVDGTPFLAFFDRFVTPMRVICRDLAILQITQRPLQNIVGWGVLTVKIGGYSL